MFWRILKVELFAYQVLGVPSPARERVPVWVFQLASKGVAQRLVVGAFLGSRRPVQTRLKGQ